MSEDASAASSSTANEVLINIKGPNAKLQVSISLDKTVAELKEAIAEADEKKDTPADRQRLIYSGRVLKDEDLLSTYKIQAGHTVHLVKGAARPAGASGGAADSASGTAPQQLPAMQAGQSPTDPLTVLNGPMGHGVMAGINPFADMGLNANDPNMMMAMFDNPIFLQQMSSMMANPAVLDQIINSNPQLAGMGPQVRQIMQSEEFRNMLSNPQAMQSMMRMSALMHDAGMGPQLGGGGGLFGGGGSGGFPAPGMPSYVQNQQPGTTPNQTAATPSAPSAGTGAGDAASAHPGLPGTAAAAAAGADANAPNPFAALASLLGGAGAGGLGGLGGAQQQARSPPAGSPGAGLGAAGSPFGMVDPALVQQLLGGMGGAGGNPLGFGGPGGFGNFGAGTGGAPADTRSPEERFAPQLAQMAEMGFIDAGRNVRALLATGGNVQAAIEYLFSMDGN